MMLDPHLSDSTLLGQTALSGLLQESTVFRPIKKPGTSGFSRLSYTSKIRLRLEYLILSAFSSSEVCDGALRQAQ